MDKNFLLDTPTAQRLYHEHAAKMPIIDYHCHLSPKMIADDYQFRSITELWLGGDHYKWRAMRTNGVDERYITGDATDWEKFEKWAETVPYTMRNPLYHWTHLELSTAFGIDEPLNPDTARSIYERCNALLATPEYTARGLMMRYGVQMVCTTDDPVDTLEYHRQIRQSGFAVKVLPAWRPDKAVALHQPEAYLEYLHRLGNAANCTITDLASWEHAIEVRMQFFASQGCIIADHGIDEVVYAESSRAEAEKLFAHVLKGNTLKPDEAAMLKTTMLLTLFRLNHKMGWAQQFHFGPMRNVNTRMYRQLGPDTGFDSIGDYRAAWAIGRYLDALDINGELTRTILYNINPADNTWVATMLGNFQDGSMPGKIQMGSGWWFNDQLYGMEAQMNALSMQGLLSRFVGMLTDSRSFLSYPRHEYFRRLLCRLLGRDVEQGMIPASEIKRVEGMVEDICYNNIVRYLSL